MSFSRLKVMWPLDVAQAAAASDGGGARCRLPEIEAQSSRLPVAWVRRAQIFGRVVVGGGRPCRERIA
jgi:hypothetical protein